LLLKFHPSTGAPIRSALESAGVATCSNADFLPALRRCCACITEPSSAALIPALLGLPLFLANYGQLAGQMFGTLIKSYPRAKPLTHLRKFNELLAAAETDPRSTAARVWIESHKGPLPPEEMPTRVAEVVLRLVAPRSAERAST
jgi:hypothetical protein